MLAQGRLLSAWQHSRQRRLGQPQPPGPALPSVPPLMRCRQSTTPLPKRQSLLRHLPLPLPSRPVPHLARGPSDQWERQRKSGLCLVAAFAFPQVPRKLQTRLRQQQRRLRN
jgi:hypothetical protein